MWSTSYVQPQKEKASLAELRNRASGSEDQIRETLSSSLKQLDWEDPRQGSW